MRTSLTPSVLVLLTLTLILTGCRSSEAGVTLADHPATQSPTAEPTPAGTAALEPEPAPTAEEHPGHRIGIRQVDGVGEFYFRDTGEVFVPRGNNYIRLDPQQRADGGIQIYHSVFDPGLYSPQEIETAFQEMERLGYNTVRVFISQNTISAEDGLDPEYMTHVIDFLDAAREYNQYVIFTMDWLPGGPYGEKLNEGCCERFNMMNVHLLTRAGLDANVMFFQDFIRTLLDNGAAVEMVLSYQLRNELYFDTNFPPFSLEEGKVQVLNGKEYDLSDPEAKRRMADENLVVWLDELREAVQDVDPGALVSVGFFWPQEPNPARIGDPRYINTAPAIWESTLDFIDLHAYPAAELTLEEYAENFGLEGHQEKPVVMGEFGVNTSALSDPDTAARELMRWQAESCQYGFDGWLLWSWDIHENDDFFSGQSGEGEIARVLSPLERPDPCQTAEFEFLDTNLALGKPVRASRVLPGEPAENLVDGTGRRWGAGAGPPQWVQVDLEMPVTVEEIRLTTAQTPEGETTHQVYAAGPGEELELVHTFSGFTQDDQELVYQPESPLENIQIIRVSTIRSPSWVAWRELVVIGGQ